MTLQLLLQNSPRLHEDPSGKLTSWQISDAVLNFLNKHVDSNSVTLETGAGLSTVLFAMKSASHTCIVPDLKLIRRIQSYCNDNQISCNNIAFKAGISEQILPSLELGNLDLVLIDGRHAFPTPFIDWYYTCEKLKVGGMMIVDDTQIWTGAILKKFLLSEPEWKLTADLSYKTAIFAKIKEYSHSKEWLDQSLVINKSRYSIMASKINRGLEALRQGNFGKIFGKVANPT
jgi:predicted O-methyltransferase YrrM